MLSEKAQLIKKDLEHIRQFNNQITKLETRKANLQKYGFPQGSKMYVDGGALNKTEEMYICLLEECAKIDRKIADLRERNFELERKLVELHNLNPTQFNMVFDRYLADRPMNVERLVDAYHYADKSSIFRIFNQIFELLVVL